MIHAENQNDYVKPNGDMFLLLGDTWGSANQMWLMRTGLKWNLWESLSLYTIEIFKSSIE